MDKKSNECALDVAQGDYVGSEISKLMGIYILSSISKIVRMDSRDICGNDKLIVVAGV